MAIAATASSRAAPRTRPARSLEAQELRYALMVHTHFSVKDSTVRGYLVIILGITSFSRLIQELDNWGKRQLAGSS